jgi:hypothetical protein
MFEALFPEVATAILFLIGIVCMIILLYISTQW